MEVRRTKNLATHVVFPMVDADGDLVTGAAGLDSEIDAWADGSAPDGFTDCTNEATEIGTTGMYYLSLTQGEMNNDYIAIQVKTSTSGAKTQVILINTTLQRADVVAISGDAAAADNLEAYCDGTTPQPVDVTTWKGSAAPAMTGDAYSRLGAPAGASVSADVAAVKSDSAAILADTGTDGVVVAAGSKAGYALTAAYDAAKTAAQAGDAMTLAAGAITAAAIATDAIDADAIKADAVAEIQSGLATAAAIAALNDFDPAADTVAHVTLVDTTTTNTDMVAAAPSAASLADAVWDEAIAGHAAAGSTGAALAAAGGSGDPWATALPGAYGAGTAGKILGDNLNAPVGTVDTAVDSIASTLGAAGAGLTDVPWNAAWDAEVQSECADALTAYDPPTKAELDAAVAPLATSVALAAVAGYVDTEMADVKAVTDKLDSALELDGAVYRLTENALEQAPGGVSALTAEDVRVEMDANSTQLAAIKAKTDTLGTVAATVSSPVADSGKITVYEGDDYDATHSRQIDVVVAKSGAPDLALGSVRLKCTQATWTGTIISGATDWTLRFQPTAAQTGALDLQSQDYEVEATLADGDIVTLARGAMSVVRDIPMVP